MISEIYNYRLIDNRYGTSGQPTEDQFHDIRKAGYDMVINLALSGSEYALKEEDKIVTGLGMSYVHIPVDFKAPGTQDFRSFCSLLQTFPDRQIFIHCIANMRVSAFMYLYRVLFLQVPDAEAEKDLSAIWEPDEVWSRFIEEQKENEIRS